MWRQTTPSLLTATKSGCFRLTLRTEQRRTVILPRWLPNLNLFQGAIKHQDRVAIIAESKKYTYASLLRHAAKGAKQLKGDHTESAVKTGEYPPRVAFLFSPGFEYVATQWSIWAAGAIAVPLASSHPPAELEYIIGDAQAKKVLYQSKFAEKIQALQSKFPLVEWEEIPDAKPSEGQDSDSRPTNINEEDNLSKDRGAMLIYTSGTTGKPKGVLTTINNIEAQSTSLIEAWKWNSKDKILHVLPLHHVHGVINALTCPLWVGATVEFFPFDARKVWDRWMAESRDLTVFMAVPTVYARLAAEYDKMPPAEQAYATKACAQFRLMVSGSAPLPDTLFAKWEKISGHKLLERYGMTEIGMALGNPYDGPRIPGTVGKPFPHVSTQIISDAGADVTAQPDATGELYVSGPQVFKEYWNKPEATAKELQDGWFKTGDIVKKSEDGMYTILGRASVDIVKSGGYKISSLEVERTLLAHPSIADVAVVGLPDEEWGQILAAMIVLRDKTKEVTVEDVKHFLQDKLAHYKIPRRVVVVGELPRNAMGKVDKKTVLKGF
ncbi:AMP-dependent synthetase and ligase [Fimicolochytrium jonesii]|uniref:AMP-dependent synthetase and ligase n=1 Tax=Fimicolochytrium jonesii TaxID=1396493 RepID=UPI0022FF2061|nr:AMP-dependent synthetase and ligase [Fimicolochytrium jonesii]KAI8822216.1 AMP-dependent synthetase and ligase [Fimicolochytrium jonesii]